MSMKKIAKGESLPLISIIIPFYNCEDVIRENIESLQTQTLENIEMIYVNDASTDSSLEIVRDYSESDNRIKCITVPHGGAGAARNAGIPCARGKYLLFLDADDYFSEELSERTYFAAEKNELDICICGARIIDEKANREYECWNALQRERIPNCPFFSPIEVADNLFQITGPFAWNKLYRRQFVLQKKALFQEIWSINDLFFTYYTLCMADRIGVCDDQLIFYRIRDDKGLTKNNDRYPNNICLAIDKLREAMLQSGLFHDYEKTFCKCAGGEFIEALDRMRTIEAFNDLFERISKVYFPKFCIYGKDDSFFIDEYVWELVRAMENCEDAFSFLLKRRQIDRSYQQRYRLEIRSLHGFIEERDEYIRERDKFILERDGFIAERDAIIAKLTVVNQEKHWYFPEENYPQGTRFAVYGFGKVGKDFVWQLSNSKHSNLVAVVDSDYESIDMPQFDGAMVGDMSCLSDIEYDYVIISPRKEDVVKQIKANLLQVGIKEEKLLFVMDGEWQGT